MKSNNTSELKTQNSKPDLSPYIAAINERFSPAPAESEATHRFSTAEIREAIKELNPRVNPSDAQVHDAMMEAGYRFSSPKGAAGLRFFWLLVENE